MRELALNREQMLTVLLPMATAAAFLVVWQGVARFWAIPAGVCRRPRTSRISLRLFGLNCCIRGVLPAPRRPQPAFFLLCSAAGLPRCLRLRRCCGRCFTRIWWLFS